MNKFYCCGVLTEKRNVMKGRQVVVIRDQFKNLNKIGFESYKVSVPNDMFKASKAEIGDTIACYGIVNHKFGQLEYRVESIHVINQLMIHNLLVTFSKQVAAIEEFEREMNAFGLD